jgi:hypothetical protein
LTYKVDCGTRGREQIVHVDRLRVQHPQVLRGETSAADSADCDEMHADVSDENAECTVENDNTRLISDTEVTNDVSPLDPHKRERRTPKWMSDYVVD